MGAKVGLGISGWLASWVGIAGRGLGAVGAGPGDVAVSKIRNGTTVSPEWTDVTGLVGVEMLWLVGGLTVTGKPGARLRCR